MQVQDNVAVSVMENMSNIYLLQKQEALTMLAPGLDKQGTVSDKIQPWLPAACLGLRATPVPGTDHGTMKLMWEPMTKSFWKIGSRLF